MDRLLIQNNNGIVFEPATMDGVSWELERAGSPGRLTFTVLKDGTEMFEEGDAVQFYHDGTPVFFGFIFAKERDRDRQIKVTAYDQMRYFKNKFTYAFEKKTASQIIEFMARDFNVATGSIANTGYIFPTLLEENKTVFDIVGDVLDQTLVNTGELFVMYDDFGKLTLKNSIDMASRLVIDKDTAENFSYTSSIDEETYNKIVLYYKNDDKLLVPYYARDEKNIGRWGLLQYFESVDDESSAQSRANALLKLYNRKTRTLSIKGAFGDPTIRAGSMVIVDMDLGDKIVKNYMLVESVKHSFKENYHTMDLTLEGSWGD